MTTEYDAIIVGARCARCAGSPFSQFSGWAMGGAASRVAADATAVGEREVGFELNITAAWPAPMGDPAQHRAWVRKHWDALRPDSIGVYANFLSDEGPEGIEAAYGGRLARLTALKDRYDPSNVAAQRQHPTEHRERRSAMSKVLVTGATGNVGPHVVAALRKRGASVRAFVRDPDKARTKLGEGVELTTGDFDDPASLRRALQGVETVFLTSADGPRKVAHETAVIDAAAAHWVHRVVKLSSPHVEIGSNLAFWDWHGRIEQYLEQAPVPALLADALVTLFGKLRGDACGEVNDTVAGLTGHPPRSFAEWAAEHAAAFAG